MRPGWGLLVATLPLAGCFDFAALLTPRQRVADLAQPLDAAEPSDADLKTLLPRDAALGDLDPIDAATADLPPQGGSDASDVLDLLVVGGDAAVPDLGGPPPDLSVADLALPDLAVRPDLSQPDLAPAPDLTPAPSVQFYKLQAAPIDVRPADLDGDGWADLVISCSTARTVVVLRNDKTGHFAPVPGQPLLLGSQSGYFAEPRDYDGDARLDVVVTLPQAAGLVLASGRGDGTFGATSTFNLPAAPTSIAAADFNGDKLVDVAVSVSGGSTGITVLTANAKGLGQAGRVVAAGSGTPAPLVAADLDGNGVVDLVVGNTSFMGTGITVLPGKGDGTFLSPISVGSAPIEGIAVTDLDVDGVADLVTGDPAQGGVAALRGLGSFSFAAPVRSPAPGRGVSHIAAADLTRSGKPDVVLVESGSDDLAVFQGKGTLQLKPRATYQTGARPAAVRVADFDRDGRLDLVSADSQGSGVTVVLLP